MSMNEIFVFGSNLAGRHGKGAALYARQHHNAVYGQGEGRQGTSYAIPTKDEQLKTRPLALIQKSVDKFIEHARRNPEDTFQLTAVGTGLAGIPIDTMKAMFKAAPSNVIKPKEFI